MRKVLPINPEPYIHTYTQHGFFNAIAGSEDKVCYDMDKSIADIIVSDFDKYVWEEQTDQLDYRNNDGKLSFYTNKWNIGMNMAFWRKCYNEDEISLKVVKQLYSNAWSSITIFITSDLECEMTNLNSYDISVGHFAKDGLFYSTEKGIHNRVDTGFEKTLTMKIIREDKAVYMAYTNGDSLSKKIPIFQLEDNIKEYRIGFAINLGNSAYYEWVFSNYIQLFAKPDACMPIDYTVNPHKDWCVHTYNPLIDYHRIKKSDLLKIDISTLEYIKQQIKLDYYVESEINDNLNLRISDDKRGKLFHQNLIYGYDDEKQCIYTLFYDQGRVFCGEITYEEFESDRNVGGTNYLYMMRYNPCFEYFALDYKRVLQLFKEYSKGENYSLYESYYQDGFIEGLKCYEYFTVGEGEEKTNHDIRIIYLFYERALCNRDRIEYLFSKGIINQTIYEKLHEVIKKEIDELQIIKNLVVRQRLRGKYKEGVLTVYLKNVIKYETEFVEKIITSLQTLSA